MLSFWKLPRSKERGIRVQVEEAKKVDFRSKLIEEQKKWRQQEEPKTKSNMHYEFCTSQIALSNHDKNRRQLKGGGGTGEEK
ncbi:uncharacterized protein MONOS_17178 [Monocercomonoides exilis]|uniref:uncharacterized protein n=1 Tax=Monocercomonoides exilis TaxID=2049356 RepID=UPI003559C96F|nr:hypothetical protein MONOS_17178 [Monocercomonoides exilis]